MAIKLAVGETSFTHLKPRITVIGVGGGGGNAISNMMAKNLEGVDFVVANTDAQALALSPAGRKIQLGLEITQGWARAQGRKSAKWRPRKPAKI